MSENREIDISLREIIHLWDSNNLFIGIKNEEDLKLLRSYFDELNIYIIHRPLPIDCENEIDKEGYVYLCKYGYKSLVKRLNDKERMIKIEEFYTKYIKSNHIVDEMLKIIEEYENR